MTILFVFSTLTLGAVVVFDEFYFHWRRNLPLWERWGHPVDSILLLIPIGILAFAEKTPTAETVYAVSGVLSCLCITKDEWVHWKYSGSGENWLHALMFILHPIVLLSGYLFWGTSLIVVRVFFFAVTFFTLYQIVFWIIYADRILKRPESAGR